VLETVIVLLQDLYMAAYAYAPAANKKNHLALTKKEHLVLIAKKKTNWWQVARVHNQSEQGLVPSNYIKLVKAGTGSLKAAAKPAATAAAAKPAAKPAAAAAGAAATPAQKGEAFVCVYDYDATGKEGYINLKANADCFVIDQTTQPGWFCGTCQGKTGWFPANYVKKK